MYELGDSIHDTITVRDASGAAVDADSLPTAVLTEPDGSTTSLVVDHPGTGVYATDYTSAAGGDHLIKWSGAVSSKPFVHTSSAYVWDPALFVASLDDVKAHLSITSSASDDELRAFILRAQSAVENRVGPLVIKTVSSYVAGGGSLILPASPVVAIVSITPIGGAQLPLAGVTVSPSGVVSGSYPYDGYTVVYTAGRTTCPPDLYLAVLEMVRHLWLTQRGSNQTVWNNPESDDRGNMSVAAYQMFPPRVMQLLGPHEQVGFA